MALVLVAGALILPETRNPHPGRLDWVSVPLSVFGMFAVIYGARLVAAERGARGAAGTAGRGRRRRAHPAYRPGAYRRGRAVPDGAEHRGPGPATPHTGYWSLLPVVIINGAGLMLTFAVTADTILAGAPRTRTGAAAAISETAMELGGTLGIAILGSVLNAYYRRDLKLPAGLTAQQTGAARASVSGGVETGEHLAGGTGRQVADAARQAFTDSLHTTTLIGGALMVLGAVAALLALRHVPAVLDDPEPESAPGLATV